MFRNYFQASSVTNEWNQNSMINAANEIYPNCSSDTQLILKNTQLLI